jgi:hypothetical protein
MTQTAAFRHEVMLYDSRETFVDGAAPFIRDAVATGEPIMVAIGAEKIDLLRALLGADADHVVFADMAGLGANPARIIPVWQEFVDAHAGDGVPMRGIGEPISADRSPTELIECQCHEALLNVAFADAPAFHLLCPYNTRQLDGEVIAEAERSHPFVGGAPSGAYRGDHAVPQFAEPLPEPPGAVVEQEITHDSLADLRAHVEAEAERAPSAASAATTSSSPCTRSRPTACATAAATGACAPGRRPARWSARSATAGTSPGNRSSAACARCSARRAVGACGSPTS